MSLLIAVAGLIFCSANTLIARSLINKLYLLITRKNATTNIDFYLVASEIINKVGESYFQQNIDDAKRTKLISASFLTRPFSDVDSIVIFETFSIIGIRNGETHNTKLKDILNSTSDTHRSNIATLISLLERLEKNFNELFKSSYILPERLKLEELKKIHTELSIKIKFTYT